MKIFKNNKGDLTVQMMIQIGLVILVLFAMFMLYRKFTLVAP